MRTLLKIIIFAVTVLYWYGSLSNVKKALQNKDNQTLMKYVKNYLVLLALLLIAYFAIIFTGYLLLIGGVVLVILIAYFLIIKKS